MTLNGITSAEFCKGLTSFLSGKKLIIVIHVKNFSYHSLLINNDLFSIRNEVNYLNFRNK